MTVTNQNMQQTPQFFVCAPPHSPYGTRKHVSHPPVLPNKEKNSTPDPREAPNTAKKKRARPNQLKRHMKASLHWKHTATEIVRQPTHISTTRNLHRDNGRKASYALRQNLTFSELANPSHDTTKYRPESSMHSPNSTSVN